MQFEPRRLLTIDTSRGRSRNRELHHPCYILVDFCAFRSFGLCPHGVIEGVGVVRANLDAEHDGSGPFLEGRGATLCNALRPG